MDEDRLSGYVSASSRASSTFKLTYCVRDQIRPDSNVQELSGDPVTEEREGRTQHQPGPRQKSKLFLNSKTVSQLLLLMLPVIIFIK